VAVLSGEVVAGIDAGTGQQRWVYEAPRGQTITGPAVVNGELVYVMSSAGMVTLKASSGMLPAPAPAGKVPNFRAVTASEPGKTALTGAGIFSAFGMPAAREGKEGK
jgi:hypothetical protein